MAACGQTKAHLSLNKRSRKPSTEASREKLEIPRHFWGLMEYQLFSTTPENEGFQVNKSIRQKLANSKRRIQRRLDKTDLRDCAKPILTASNIHYEIAQRTRGL